MNGQGKPIAIGVLGCADIAIRRVLPVLAAHSAIRLVAVASRDQAKADTVAMRFGCAGILGYQQLLDRDDIDAVYIPLPPALHHPWVTAALRAGKHVLVEKPLGTSYQQAAEMVQLSREHRLVLVENFMFLHHSQHDAVRKLADADTLGELRVFAGSFAVPPLPRTSYRYQQELGGGALLDTGVYPLRAAQLYLGSDLTVLGACLRVDPASGVDVAGSALLCTPAGVAVQLDFGFTHSYRSRYALWGSAGRISVLRAFTPPQQHRPTVRIEQQDRLTELSLPPDDQVRNSMTAFARAVTAGYGDCTHLLTQARLVEQVRTVAHVVEDR